MVTVADQIRVLLPDLPRAERRVAHEVLSRYPVAGLETVARLAARSSVSGPTVIRFVGRLGFEGYPAFQEALLREVGERTASPLVQYDQRAEGAEVDVLERSRSALVSCLSTSLAHLDRGLFAETVERLSTARRVFTAGGRFSGLSAQALALHLDLLRPGVTHLPSEQWVSYALSARRGDLLVVFDVRRYQRLTVELGREASRKGAEIVLITDPWLSPLALEASVVLSVGVVGPRPFDTLVAVDGLVETLVAAVVERLGDQPKNRIEEYDRLWEQQYFSHPETPNTPSRYQEASA